VSITPTTGKVTPEKIFTFRGFDQVCQIFPGTTYQIYRITIKYNTLVQNIPNGHKIYQNLPMQDTPKFTQIGLFGLKICHLATLDLIRDMQLLPIRHRTKMNFEPGRPEFVKKSPKM
jgi:hypothetical protein